MLNRTTYFIREHVGFLKFSDTYDILDPDTQQQIGIAKEKPSVGIHLLRLIVNRQFLPTKVSVYEGSNFEDQSKLLFSIERGFTFLRSKVNVCGTDGQVLGWFKSKLFSFGGAFYVHDAAGNQIAMVKGDWKGWNFRFLDSTNNEIGTVTKKWSGIGKELFTTADNYVISLNQQPAPGIAVLLLAAGLAIDIVYKEGK